jgi:hypothetical protein
MKGLLIILLVVGVLVGGLLVLRSSRGTGMPDKDVLERAARRAREQAEREKD